MNMLAAALPILCFAALLRRENFRESFLVSAIITGLFIAILTETLSHFKLIGYVPLVISWTLYSGVLLVWRYRRGEAVTNVVIEKLTLTQIIVGALLACVIVVAGITAIVAAPNNFDSLTYHLPRIMHWIQNASARHYPTHIDRQLTLAPFSEFTIMHLQLLSGSDRLANCVQWFAMVGSAVGVSLIARFLGGSLNGQLIAAVVAVSVPMGLLQATSTQNDYAVTLWLVCLTYFIIKARQNNDLRNAVLIGACLSLAIFTKGTAYLVALPFMFAYVWHLAATKGMKTLMFHMLIVVSLVLLVNGSHYARNIAIYGNPISPGTGNDIICTQFDATALLSCVQKNIATQLATGLQSTNNILQTLTLSFHNIIGVDINDPDLTGERNFILLPARAHEDFAPNPLHMTLMLLSVATLVCWRKEYGRETVLFSIITIMSFVVLSAGIQWNIFISRYFLPVFVISAPFISLLYDREKIRKLVNYCAILFLAMSILVLANNQMRPLTGPQSVFVTSRTDQYFMVSPQAISYFSYLDDMIKGQQIHNVGILDRNGNMWEYLLWMMLKDNGVNYRIEHVDVKNNSGKIMLEDFSKYVPVIF